jgi:hypothetical protein
MNVNVDDKLYCIKDIGDFKAGKLYIIQSIEENPFLKGPFIRVMKGLDYKRVNNTHLFGSKEDCFEPYTNWFITEKEYKRNFLIELILL